MPLQYGNNSINIKRRIFKFGSNAEWTMAICVASGGNGFFFFVEFGYNLCFWDLVVTDDNI